MLCSPELDSLGNPVIEKGDDGSSNTWALTSLSPSKHICSTLPASLLITESGGTAFREISALHQILGVLILNGDIELCRLRDIGSHAIWPAGFAQVYHLETPSKSINPSNKIPTAHSTLPHFDFPGDVITAH
jgi:hypothetical protein